MRAFLIFLLGLGLVAPLHAQSPDPGVANRLYRTEWKVDLPIIAGGIGGYYALIWWDGRQTLPTDAEILALNRQDVWAFDRIATYQDSRAMAHLSDIGMYTGLLAPALLYLDPAVRADGASVGVVAFEVAVLNTLITQGSKVLVRRLRPYMYNPEVSLDRKHGHDAVHSFYSGHTSFTTSLAFFTATTYQHYHPNSPWRYAVWTGSALVPAITGFARVAAGKHYPTDVLVGYLMGAAVGLLVPELHRRWAE